MNKNRKDIISHNSIHKESDVFNIFLKKKLFDNNEIKKLFENEEDIISLANNKNINLNKEIIDFIIDNNLNIRLYIDNLEINRINTLLSINGRAIQYIKEPTKLMVYNSIESDVKNIIYINNLDKKIFCELISDYPECLNYISYLDEEFQRYILDLDIDNIKYFTDCSKAIIKEYASLVNINAIVSPSVKEAVLEEIDNSKYKCNVNHMKRCIDYNSLDQRYKTIFNYEKFVNGYETILINSEEALDSHINYLAKKINCKKLELATGYVYKSGLVLLDSIIDKLLSNNNKVKIIMGSLFQKNDNIDKGTASYMNNLLNQGMKLRTYVRRFFHGKLYILYGDKYSCVFIGSSNISKGGFYENCETNVLFIIDNSSDKLQEFKQYYNNLWCCSQEVDEIMFNDSLLENIENLDGEKNDEVNRKFDYLRKYKPNKEIESVNAFIGCIYETDYTAFYYKRLDRLLILESKVYQNAIYIFENVDNIGVFLKSLKNKEQCIKLPEYRERINHSKDDTYKERVISIIESKIKKYNLQSYYNVE